MEVGPGSVGDILQKIKPVGAFGSKSYAVLVAHGTGGYERKSPARNVCGRSAAATEILFCLATLEAPFPASQHPTRKQLQIVVNER